MIIFDRTCDYGSFEYAVRNIDEFPIDLLMNIKEELLDETKPIGKRKIHYRKLETEGKDTRGTNDSVLRSKSRQDIRSFDGESGNVGERIDEEIGDDTR